MTDVHKSNEQLAREQQEAADRLEKHFELYPEDRVRPGDETDKVTTAQLKRWRQRTMTDLNKILTQFQQDQVHAQVRTNLVWNGLNACLRAIHEKGLISNEDVQKAGEALMAEANANLQKAKDAVSKGQQLPDAAYSPTPLDTYKRLIYSSKKVVKP